MIPDHKLPAMSFLEQVEEATERAKAELAQEVAGEPITVRIRRAVELTGIGRSKLYELIAAGEIDVIKVGSSTLVIFASLKAFVERRRGPAYPPFVSRRRQGE